MFKSRNKEYYPGEKPLIEKIMNDPQPVPRKVPDYMRKKGGAWYWTGAMIMIVFIYEVITGLILLLYYQPSNAYVSTETFLNSTPYGSIIISTHLYGAYAMIVLIYLHLLRNLFVGAYKRPRESQWITGVLLLLLTIAVGFFGYSMSGDVLSADATDVGRGIAQATPVIGTYLMLIFFGSGTNISLFTRMLGWHIVLAAGVGILFAVHFFIAEYNTIMPSHKDANYKAPAIDKDDGTYKPWYPYNLMYMMQYLFLVFGFLVLIPSVLAILPNVPDLFSPFPSVSPSSPLAVNVPAYPPWFLLFVYKALDFKMLLGVGPFWGTVIFAGAPLIYLLIVPYVHTNRSLLMRDNPIPVSFGILGLVYYVGLSAWGALAPGVPISDGPVLLFFILPFVFIVGLSLFVAKLVKENRITMPNIGRLFFTLTILAFAAFGSGMLILASVSHPVALYLIPMILLLMVTAISLTVTYAMIKGIHLRDESIEEKHLSKNGYTFAASGFIMVSIVVLFEITIIPPTSPSNNALYGIGLGLILLIIGAFIRIYRASVYGE